MSDKDAYRWYRHIRAPMSFESYDRLPRHPSYKFEYWDGQLRISPRWRSHRFFLELKAPEECEKGDEGRIATIRPLAAADWEKLPEVLAAAFRDSPPLGMLGYKRRVWAARDWLRSTRDGSEGPLVEPACMVAIDPTDDSVLFGALVVTLITGRDRSWYAELRAAVGPPPDLAEGREQAQISWIFVRNGASRRGVGSALLSATVRVLWTLGHRELASATHFGNESSLTWHWRNGFRLLPHSDSVRLWKLRQLDEEGP
jgi:GNAT superfamily N-acetyltransferase